MLSAARADHLDSLTRAPRALLQALNDPGETSMRRGLRAGVVAPVLLATAILLHVDQTFTTFLIFGALSLLAFADFGGRTRSRVSAYIIATLAGLPLIAVGTLASANVWIAVVASVVVGFTLAGVGVLGGYFLSAQTPLMLAFVLAVTSAAPLEAAAPRLIGWAVGGSVSVLAGWLIWPRSGHVALRAIAASVIRAVSARVAAAAVTGESLASSKLDAEAHQKLDSLRKGFAAAQRRPSGATRRDRALAELVTELDRALTFAPLAAASDSEPAQHEATILRADVVRALSASAAVLDGADETHKIEPLVQAQDAHRLALDGWVAEQLQSGTAAESIRAGLVTAHWLRLMSMVALATAQNAELVAGLPTTGPDWQVRPRGVWSTFLEEMTPSSIWLRNSLRTALGVALAVFVARSLEVMFAFWVVLGTLSALRSNVSATGRTAALAIGGTALGVLIAVPFVGVTGADPWVLWIVLPVLVFLAAYAPTAINFIVGQVAFSVLVVVLFNVLAPTDWHLGLVRLEDAALGAAVSLAVGLLLWPSGASGQLRSALASLYDAGASSLSFSFRRVLTDADEAAEAGNGARSLAQTQAIRAEEVFEQFLNERTRKAPSIDVWAKLLSTGKGFLLIGDLIDWYAQHGYAASAVGPPATTLGGIGSDEIANILRLAEEIRSGSSLRVALRRDVSSDLRSAALASLSQPELATSPAALRATMGLVGAAVWLGQLDALLQDLEAPVAETIAARAMPWWR